MTTVSDLLTQTKGKNYFKWSTFHMRTHIYHQSVGIDFGGKLSNFNSFVANLSPRYQSTLSVARYVAFFSSAFTARKSKMWMSHNRVSLRNAWTSAWSTMQSNSGVDIFALVWLQRAGIMSKCYDVPIWQHCLFSICIATLKVSCLSTTI